MKEKALKRVKNGAILIYEYLFNFRHLNVGPKLTFVSVYLDLIVGI